MTRRWSGRQPRPSAATASTSAPSGHGVGTVGSAFVDDEICALKLTDFSDNESPFEFHVHTVSPLFDAYSASTSMFAFGRNRCSKSFSISEPPLSCNFQIQRQTSVRVDAAQPLASQRSMDDDEVDYSFTKQSVAERMRVFMRQQQQQQPPASYHSVPRSGYSASRFRQPRPVSSIEGGGHHPLSDLGWSPPAEKIWNARRHPGQPASRAAFEQTSYLPSQGIGAQPESPPIALRSRTGQQNFGQQRHSVSGGGFVPQAARARNGTTATAASDQPFAAYNSRQYNTPINLYSKQNAANAFEGQTGMAVGRQPVQQGPSRQGNSGQAAPAPINQSQVYKLVHEEDDRKPSRGQGSGGPTHQPSWTGGSSRKWESEPDEPGVSEF